MFVSRIINRGKLSVGQIAIFGQKVYVINEYVVERMEFDKNGEITTTTLCFPNFKQDYQLRRFTVYERELFLLIVSRNISYTYKLQNDNFICMHEFAQPAINFMVSNCNSGLLYFYMLQDHTCRYVNQAGKCGEYEVNIVGFQNTNIGALILEKNKISDRLMNYTAQFDQPIAQIVEDDSNNALYILLENNHVYKLMPKEQPKCILTHSFSDFPILRLIIFQQKVLTINANHRIYSLETLKDTFQTTLQRGSVAYSSKLMNLGRLHDYQLADVLFAGSLQRKVFIMSSTWQQVMFDPMSKNLNLTTTTNYEGLINCQCFDGGRIEGVPDAKAYGFLINGCWWLTGDSCLIYDDLKAKQRYQYKLADQKVLNGTNHQVAVVSPKHLYVYYTIDKLFFRITIKNQAENVEQTEFGSEIATISFSADNNYDGFAIDTFNKFFRTDFQHSRVLICQFKGQILFSLFTASFILLQAEKDMFLIINDRIVDKFELHHTPTSAALLNITDPIGHQVIAFAQPGGIIEIRHLLSFTVLMSITVLNRKIKQLVVLEDELRCLDADTNQIFVLQDERDEGSVVPVDELLLNQHLI